MLGGLFGPLTLLNLSPTSGSGGGGGSGSAGVIVPGGSSYATEIRVKFPGPTDTLMPPTELSGAIVTISSGSFTASSFFSLWYEKESATSATGNVYVTSSAGRLQLTSASIFNGNFYNLAVVKDMVTGSMTLYAVQCTDGETTYATSSFSTSGTVGYPLDFNINAVQIGSSSVLRSRGQFWAQEFRQWSALLTSDEVVAHSDHFESYGRQVSWNNKDLKIHWRLNDGTQADANGNVYVVDSTLNHCVGTGSNFVPNQNPFTKFLLDYAYIPSIDYGWNQKKVRTYTGSFIETQDRYDDERFVSLEFNLYDALNEDISHLMSSYEEIGDFIGHPMNRYRSDYEGLHQMRETYFKRLQGQLSFRTFVDMMDFFDTAFIGMVQRLLPARSLFKGDELIVESHMLERPKFQYQLKPVQEGTITISGSIAMTDRGDDDLFG